MAEITFLVAFLAGLVSFLSPCILPLVPAYLTFLAGTTLSKLKDNSETVRGKVFLSSVCFVLGFTFVFSILGVLLQGVLSSFAFDLRNLVALLGGGIIIFFGLMLVGIINLDFLQREYKINLKMRGGSYLSSFLFGAGFAAGWTPCVGPVLGAVLTISATNPAAALPLMLAYSLGLGVPFILAGVFFSASMNVLNAIKPHIGLLNKIFGLILIAIGVLVATNNLHLLANLAPAYQFLGG